MADDEQSPAELLWKSLPSSMVNDWAWTAFEQSIETAVLVIDRPDPPMLEDVVAIDLGEHDGSHAFAINTIRLLQMLMSTRRLDAAMTVSSNEDRRHIHVMCVVGDEWALGHVDVEWTDPEDDGPDDGETIPQAA